jgi:olefin beta-lactone synthetase
MTPPLTTRLQCNAEHFPDKPAFIFPGRKSAWDSIPYRQLAEKSELFARGLSALGIQPGMRAALMAPPSIDLFALVYALLRCGIVPVMVDPSIGLRNVTPCLAEVAPQIYIGSPLTQALRLLFGWGRASLKLTLTLAEIARAGANASLPAPVEFDPQSEAAIVYTSGSTGLPKGAVYSVDNFAAQLEILSEALTLRGDEIALPAAPLFAIISCLLGVTSIIPEMHFPSPAKIDPAKTIAAIQTHGCNIMFASPAALARLARFGTARGITVDGLKKVITAGAPAPVAVQKQFIRLLPPEGELYSIYGATEALPVSIVNSREILSDTCHLSAQGAGVCIGRPVKGMQVQILPVSDEALTAAEDLRRGGTGEIAVCGRAVTTRYVGREDINRLAKICKEDGVIIHRMGDLGYFDEKGRLWYCGRKSQRVITSTGTLFTEPVEGIFNAHPTVYRSALVGVEKEGVTEAWLWVELDPASRGMDRKKLRAELLGLAKSHTMTRTVQTILFHPAFPTDVRHNSKIIREKLALEASRR